MSREILDIVSRDEVVFGQILILLFFGAVCLQSFHTNAKRAYTAFLRQKEQADNQSQGLDIATGQQRREGRI